MQTLDSSLNSLYFEIDEHNTSVQKLYFTILNKLIDGICLMRYKNSQRAPHLSSAAALHSYIYDSFVKSDIGSITMIIENISEKLWWLSYCLLDKKYIRENMVAFYRQYIAHKNFDDTEFSNKILNVYRNAFLKKEKERIYSLLKTTIPLSPKRKSANTNRYRLTYVQNVIQRKDFDKIYLTTEEFEKSVDEVFLKLCSNKDLQKKGVIIDQNLKTVFKEIGILTDEAIAKNVSSLDVDVVKYIKNTFNRFKIKIGRLYQVPDNLISTNLDFNLTNFQVVSQHSIDEMFMLLSRYLEIGEYNEITANIDYFEKVYMLFPFINLFREFEMDTFVYLIIYYPKIEERLKKELSLSEITSDIIYDNLYLVLKITKNYENMVDCASTILGSDFNKYVCEDELTEYLKFYTRMFKRMHTSIPNINIKYESLTLTSSELYEKERLLIGRKFSGSCIDLLNIAGTQTFSEVLLGDNSDVIMVRNEKGEFISRILAFRKGNVIQLVARLKDDKYPLDLYKQIASEMFNLGLEKGDNLDYIVINSLAISDCKGISETIIDEPLFYTAFPHADTSSRVIILASNPNAVIKLYESPKVSYEGIRRINYSPTYNDVIKKLCLYYYLIGDSKNVDLLINENFHLTFDSAIIGEDWLVIKTDGNLEKYIFPTATEKAYFEIGEAINQKTLALLI